MSKYGRFEDKYGKYKLCIPHACGLEYITNFDNLNDFELLAKGHALGSVFQQEFEPDQLFAYSAMGDDNTVYNYIVFEWVCDCQMVKYVKKVN